MRLADDRRSFVVDHRRSLPVKFAIVEDETIPADMLGALRDHDITTSTRVVRAYFENRWGVSVIWGSMTYSTNHDHPWGAIGRRDESPPFVEEPTSVEVAVIMPDPIIVPEQTIEAGDDSHTFPEHEVEIWGSPVGYVDAAQLLVIIDTVSRFPSDGLAPPEYGPDMMTVGGVPMLVWNTEVE